MQIGTFVADVPVVLAPMAGVTDAAFRRICREMGAGLTVGKWSPVKSGSETPAKAPGAGGLIPTIPFPSFRFSGLILRNG